MKTILRNLLSVLRRFKMAMVLNMLGLSVAFAAFMIIMMQVDYDYNFDRSQPGNDCIYRMEVGGIMGYEWQSALCRPLVEAITASSPHIVGGTFVKYTNQMFFSVETSGGKQLYQETALEVSTGYPDVFIFDMVEGSARSLDEPRQALIPQSLARKMFGSESATGRRLEGRSAGEDQTLTVGGVYHDFPLNTSTLNVIYLAIPSEENLNNWSNWNYQTYLRVNEPENIEGLFENFKKSFDTSIFDEGFSWEESGISVRFTPLADTHFIKGVANDGTRKASRQTLMILLGIAVVIVVITGINYTNFSAALTPKRIKSINTQKVLGGDERMIRFALVVEAVSIASVSYLIALGIVVAAKDTPVARLLDADITLSAHAGLAALTGSIAILTGILAGLYPARYMTSFPPALVLKGSFGLSPRGRRLRSALISVQFIASFALIIGASFMFLQNHFMQNAPLGYETDQLIIAGINDNINKERSAFSNQLKSFAGVDDVTYSEFTLSGSDGYMGWGRMYHDKQITFQCLPVDPSFMKVMGIEIVEGRSFREEDALTRNGVLIFNKKARDTYNLVLNDRINDIEIIGFMPDIKFASFRQEISPMAFYVWGTENWLQTTPSVAYVKVKAGSDLRSAIAHVRTSLKSFDDEYPFNVRFFDEVLEQTYQKELNFSTLISLFSLVAILISIVGVFGLVVFESEYRRKEISLRKVFGSTTGEILLLFNKTYLRILILCFVVAAPVAWYTVSRWLENFAYRTPLYWWVYLIAFALVSLLTACTVTFQNWRAANMNPAEGIKTE
jgi:putative ABC transport system permease protein